MSPENWNGRVSESSSQSWKKAGVLLCSPKPRVFPKIESLAWNNNPNYEICIHNQAATAQQNPVYNHSVMKVAGWFVQSITKTTSPLLYHLVRDRSEGRWQLSILISGSFQTLPTSGCT